jgi:hypothetical protein
MRISIGGRRWSCLARRRGRGVSESIGQLSGIQLLGTRPILCVGSIRASFKTTIAQHLETRSVRTFCMDQRAP